MRASSLRVALDLEALEWVRVPPLRNRTEVDAVRDRWAGVAVPGMERHRAEWWAKRIEELAQGGDAEEIARRHGVKTRTLIWWRSQLRKKARERTGRKPRLLPVVVRSAPRPVRALAKSALEVFVEVGDVRMTLRGAVTAEHLAAIVSASARAC